MNPIEKVERLSRVTLLKSFKSLFYKSLGVDGRRRRNGLGRGLGSRLGSRASCLRVHVWIRLRRLTVRLSLGLTVWLGGSLRIHVRVRLRSLTIRLLGHLTIGLLRSLTVGLSLGLTVGLSGSLGIHVRIGLRSLSVGLLGSLTVRLTRSLLVHVGLLILRLGLGLSTVPIGNAVSCSAGSADYYGLVVFSFQHTTASFTLKYCHC